MTPKRTPLLVALVAGLVMALTAGCGDDETSEGGSDMQTGPAIVEIADLSAAADRADGDIYWLGERRGMKLELSEKAGGEVTIRYLPEGTEAGAPRSEVLTVVTYPSDDGVKEVRQATREIEGATTARTPDGAILLVEPTGANNAHLAFPGGDSQVEVYSPVPGQALKLASGGKVDPVP